MESYAIESEALTRFVVPDLDEFFHQLVSDDIGGDEQRVHSMGLEHRDRGVRLAWAPVWTGKLGHMDRVFAVNARSGSVVISAASSSPAAPSVPFVPFTPSAPAGPCGPAGPVGP